jgi:hypothetical protein
MSLQKTTSTSTTFTVNGQTYASLDEMPPDVRRDFEETMRRLTTDRDGNGIPDIFENAASAPDQKNVVIKTVSKRVIVDGKESNRLDEIPPELRRARSDGLDDTRPTPPAAWVYKIGVVIAILLIAGYILSQLPK